jgi:hypothetical protein
MDAKSPGGSMRIYKQYNLGDGQRKAYDPDMHPSFQEGNLCL